MGRFIDGFDHYNASPGTNDGLLAKWRGGSIPASVNASIISSITPFGTGNALRWNFTTGTPYLLNLVYGTFTPASPNQQTIVFGFNLYLVSSGGSTAPRQFAVIDSATEQCSIGIDNANKIQAFRGTTNLATSALALSPTTWYWITVIMTVDNTNGVISVNVDGTNWINFAGDTQVSANAYGTLFRLGRNDATAGPVVVIDDFFCFWGESAPLNTHIQKCRIRTGLPSGAGAVTQWTPLSGSNWQNVDENPPDSDTSYNSSNTPGQIDTFNHNLPTITGAVFTVQVTSLVRQDDAAARIYRAILRRAGVNAEGPDYTVSSGYIFPVANWYTDPFTSLPFVAADLAGTTTEIGYKNQA